MKKSEVRRHKERSSYDLNELITFLNKSHYVTVSFEQDDTIFSIPMLHAIYEEKIYLHAAVGSRFSKSLMNCNKVTLSSTEVSGIVLSKSLFNSSMNYTSAVIFGSTKRITNEEVMNSAFENMIDRFFEGRYADARKPTESEWKQTAVLEFTIDEFSMKKRSGPPIEAEEDVDLPIWSGVVPIKSSFGKPEKDMTTSKNLDLPEYLDKFNAINPDR